MNARNENLSLFPIAEVPAIDLYKAEAGKQEALGQYPTPVWFAEALIERHFSHLGPNDMAWELACGPGAFLMALPDYVPAVGFEIDPRTAEIARINTGRKIITGDFTTVECEGNPTVVITNPPFQMDLIDRFLDKSHKLLPEGGQVGMILPAYAFQTAERVVGYSDMWSLFAECIPRNIYPGLSLPLLFAKFTKDRKRTMIGLALYHEAADMLSLKKKYREVLCGVGKSVWRAAVANALVALGGRANVEAIYKEIEGKKPTRTTFWREQIRKVLRQADNIFKAEGDGWYSICA
jgi:site-specific DNA-methyltransferase (adenine-specific)